MVRGKERAHGDGLVDAAKTLIGEVGFDAGIVAKLSLCADGGHLRDGLDWIFSGGRFAAQHHGVGTVEHRIGHVAHLGTRGHGVDDHAFHHLCSGDGDLVHFTGQANHAFLQRRHRGIAYFHGQVSTRHHDAVAGAQDFLERGNGFTALNLGNERGLVPPRLTRYVSQLTRHFHIGRVLREAHREVLGLKPHGRADVFHILGGERRCRQAAARPVDAFVVRQFAADHHRGVHRIAQDAVDGQAKQPVVEKQGVARANIARQVFVVQPDGILISQGGARCIQHKSLTHLEHDLARFELAHANFRALQIGHDRDIAAGTLRHLAHQRGTVDMVLRATVGKIEAYDVNARSDHALQNIG